MLGHELVLGGRVVSDKRLDYVALGHIHKHQALGANEQHPPIVYPGSIERIDFGEVRRSARAMCWRKIGKGAHDWSLRAAENAPLP